MEKNSEPLVYVPATLFYESLGLHFEVGTKLVARGVLRPDATLNGRPIFLADAQTFDRAKNTIALFRTRQAHRLASVKELVSRAIKFLAFRKVSVKC